MSNNAMLNEINIHSSLTGSLTSTSFAVKEMIAVKNFPTGLGHEKLREYRQNCDKNAYCVEQLLNDGATLTGIAKMDEFAFGLLGENEFDGTPINPKARDRVPGGSSSGSASLVADKKVDFALGTDTGGSVRVPAAYCGIYGFRPSHGLISTEGVLPIAPSFDTVGIFTRDIDLMKKVFQVFQPEKKVGESRIYFLADAFDLINPQLNQKIKKSNLINLQEIVDIEFKQLSMCYSQIHMKEVWPNIKSLIENAKPTLSRNVEKSVKFAASMAAVDISSAYKIRDKFRQAMNDFLSEDNLICLPTTIDIAPKLKTIGVTTSSKEYYQAMLNLSAVASLGELPQLQIPMSISDEAPFGLSFIAKHLNDELLLTVGAGSLWDK